MKSVSITAKSASPQVHLITQVLTYVVGGFIGLTFVVMTVFSMWRYQYRKVDSPDQSGISKIFSLFVGTDAVREEYQDRQKRDLLASADRVMPVHELASSSFYTVEFEETSTSQQVWLINEAEQIKYRLMELASEDTPVSGGAYFENGSLFVTFRLDKNLDPAYGKDQDWRDELWVFPSGKVAKKLYESRAFDYAVNKQATTVVIAELDQDIPSTTVYEIESDTVVDATKSEAERRDAVPGKAVWSYSLVDLLNGEINQTSDFELLGWDSSGSKFYGSVALRGMVTSIVEFSLGSNTTQEYLLKDLNISHDFSFNPDRLLLVYGTTPNGDVNFGFKAPDTERVYRQLHIHNLETQDHEIIYEAETTAFKPRWISFMDFRFNPS